MHYFITSSQDSYITENQPSHITQFRNKIDKNYGGDELLELKKEFTNVYSTSPDNVSRILIKFDYSDFSSSIADGSIPKITNNHILSTSAFL